MTEVVEQKDKEQFNFWGIGAVVIILIIIAVFFDIDKLRGWILEAGVWAPIVFIVLKVSTIVIAPLSGSPLYPLVGLLFGFWPGILYVAIGDFLGYTISFLIARTFGQKIVFKLISGNEEGAIARIVNHISGPKGFFQACMTLFAMPEALSYGAGLSRLPYHTFISILMPLSIVGASVLVFFGSILEPKSDSALIGLILPMIGAGVVFAGGSFFLKGIVDKKAKLEKVEKESQQ